MRTYTKLVQAADNNTPRNAVDVGRFYAEHGRDLGLVAAAVMLYLMGESEGGRIERSPKAIADVIGSSRMTVLRALESLAARGAIRQEEGRATRPGLWVLSDTYTKLVQASLYQNEIYQGGTTKLVQVKLTNTNTIQAAPVDTRDKGTQEFNLEPERDKSLSLSPDGEEAYTPEFEDAWRRYGRKDGKRPAFKAWKRLPVKRRAEVLRAIDAMAAAREVDYRPYLCKFLRNGWEDWTHGPPNGKQATRLPGDSTVNPSKAAGSQPFVNPFRGGPK